MIYFDITIQTFAIFEKKSLLFSPRLHSFDQKYSKNSITVEYYINSK